MSGIEISSLQRQSSAELKPFPSVIFSSPKQIRLLRRHQMTMCPMSDIEIPMCLLVRMTEEITIDQSAPLPQSTMLAPSEGGPAVISMRDRRVPTGNVKVVALHDWPAWSRISYLQLLDLQPPSPNAISQLGPFLVHTTSSRHKSRLHHGRQRELFGKSFCLLGAVSGCCLELIDMRPQGPWVVKLYQNYLAVN